MKKTKKNIAGKVTALVLMLTVVSCCFLGSTFAKYTSSKTGTAQVGVAKWQVDGISENSETSQTFGLTVEKLSPAIEADAEGNWVNQVAETTYTITNKSDVDALITVNTAGDFTVTPVENAKYNGMTVTWDGTAKKFTYVEGTETKDLLTQDEIKGAITIDFTVEGATLTNGAYTLAAHKEGQTDATLTIKFTVKWTTPKDATSGQPTDEGNRIDTLIGMYVASLTKDITVTATQASKLPA